MHTNNFLFQISGGTFRVVVIFLVRCSSRSIVIFLIVSKEIQKYDQRKFYFFCRKETFLNMVFTLIAEKQSQKKLTIFFPYTKIVKQKSQAKFRITNFAKYIIAQTSNTKEIRENVVKKIVAEIFL